MLRERPAKYRPNNVIFGFFPFLALRRLVQQKIFDELTAVLDRFATYLFVDDFSVRLDRSRLSAGSARAWLVDIDHMTALYDVELK